MASEKQKELFTKLANEKQFPAGTKDPVTLIQEFAAAPTDSASEWIEKALALPDKGAVPPPF